MFERFTESAKAVLVEAQDVAIMLKADYLMPAHLLYGCAEVRDESAGRPLRDAGVGEDVVLHVLRPGPESAAGPVDRDALRALGIDYDEIRASVEATFGPGALEQAPDRRETAKTRGGRPRFTPAAKKSLELGLRAAVQLQDRRIRPGHLLIGVLRVEDEAVNGALREAGTNAEVLTTTVLAALAAPPA